MSEEQTQEQIQELGLDQVKDQGEGKVQEQVQQPVPQNKVLLYFKNRNVLSLIAYLFIRPLFIGALMGLLSVVVFNIFSIDFDVLSHESPFKDKFLFGFYIFYPIVSVIDLVRVIGINIIRKYKQYVILLVLAPLWIFMVWNLGGKQLLGGIRGIYTDFIDGRIENAIYFGDAHAQLQNSDDAISQYKKAVFFDKYLQPWNDNKNLPVLYYKIACSYGDTEDFDHTIEYLEKSLEAYSKYSPEDLDKISLVYLYGCITYGAENDYAMVKSWAYKANEYYKNNPDTVNRRSYSQSFIWLAHAYFNEGDYLNAAECLEVGIPTFYDTIDWGYNDDNDALVLTILYKEASLAYSNIGNQEKYQEYNEKYEDSMWYRDLTESDLDYYINYFHWMNR